MSMPQDRARIVVGSRFAFTLYLVDGDARPVSLAGYTSANLVFANAKGERTAIALTVPGANPDKGALEVSGLATGADDKWTNADLELINADGTTVLPINNKFEIVKRNTPAA